MSDAWWPDGEQFPSRVDDFNSMTPCDFERFAVGVLRVYYGRQDIEILGGKCGPDGGRDGEGELEIGGSDPFPELAGYYRIWIEAKHLQRRGEPSTAEAHLAAAFVKNVSKVVFVSSQGFTEGATKRAEAFSRKAGLDCTFLDGKRLLAVARHLNLPGSLADDTGAADGPLTESLTFSDVLQLNTEGGFVLSRWQTQLDPMARRSLTVPKDEPVFLAVRLTVGLIRRPRHIQIALIPPEGHDVALVSGAATHTVAAGDQINLLFAVLTRDRQAYQVSDFALAVEDEEESLELDIDGGGSVTVTAPVLKHVPTPEQEAARKAIAEAYQTWGRQRPALVVLEAPAGHGKSMLLRASRRDWLAEGTMEVLVDCEVVKTPDEFLLALFKRVFPVDVDCLTASIQDRVEQWLQEAGLTPSSAAKVARTLCCEGHLPRGTGELLRNEMVVACLRALSGGSAAVLVVDDLHKGTASLIKMIGAVHDLLVDLHVPLFILTTTRHVPDDPDNLAQAHWVQEMRALQARRWVDAVRFRALDQSWAVRTLRETFPGDLTVQEAEALVDQVGPEPFALTEAIRYLMQPRDVGGDAPIRHDVHAERIVFHDTSAIHERIEDRTLARATESRLRVLMDAWRSHSPHDVGADADLCRNLLQAAALCGRLFTRAAIMPFLPDDERRIDRMVGLLEREGVFSSSAFVDEADVLQFTHDLIRRSVLSLHAERERLPALRRVAVGLIAHAEETQVLPSRQVTLLAYASGRGERFLDAVEELLRDEDGVGRSSDVLPLLFRAVDVIDPTRLPDPYVKRNRPRAVDDILVELPPPSAPGVRRRGTSRDKRLLGLLEKVVAHAAPVLSSSADLIERAANEALFLAEALGEQTLRLTMNTSLVRLWIGRGRPDKGLDVMRRIGTDLERFSETVPIKVRADALIEQGISYRLLGDCDTSQRLLEQAAELMPGSAYVQWRVSANVGALYYYSDADLRRSHWQKAYQTAAEADQPGWTAHALLDLASLDIIDDAWGEAVARVREAQALITQHEVEDQSGRAMIMSATLAMLDDRLEEAMKWFEEAEDVAVLQSADRRLWKSRAGRANVFELLGDLSHSHIEDRRTLDRVPDLERTLNGSPGQERRVTIMLGNIALRARHSEAHAALLAGMPLDWQAAAHRLAEAADEVASGQRTTGFPHEHCKMVRGRPRYVMT